MPLACLPSKARLLPPADRGVLRSVTPPAPNKRRNVTGEVARRETSPTHSHARQATNTDLRAGSRAGEGDVVSGVLIVADNAA